jgi:outer membrane receptor for ferrienterochelin and colicin
LFEDAQDGGTVRNYQHGAYGQASRALLRDRLKLSVAGCLDKFKNFGTAFSPRAAVVYAAGVDKQHNFRFNFSRAYRSPTQTDQYIRNITKDFEAGTRSFYT